MSEVRRAIAIKREETFTEKLFYHQQDGLDALSITEHTQLHIYPL